MPRLFVAIDLPEEIKASLSQLCCAVTGARWVATSQIHLTLRFIGDVDPQTVSQIKKALSVVQFASFILRVAGVGHFPPRGFPRVLWVGLEPHPELIALQQRIESALQQAGVLPEARPFSPHITLARLKETPPAAVAAFESLHRELAYPPFTAAEYILYSSVLTPKGAIHRKEEVFRSSEEAASR
ncbi:RNA 2',3'-cyclic phosphodiesterase [Citrifermentans bremense]|uniref:RNA 2',3'-cyclic phosphodiesterase n=1 Tax=Citrifermentans bremense TaxID=60035 RepID=UPI0004277B17|nr:RNA 2',3'-cyclic phosphodiesterase [Citrifermentans bremense]